MRVYIIQSSFLTFVMLVQVGCYNKATNTADSDTPPASDTIDGDHGSPSHSADTDNTDSVVSVEIETDDSQSEASQDKREHEDSVGIDWIPLPPGTFMMGSPEEESGHDASERLHEVTLTHGFEMAATEVTIGQWSALGFPLNPELVDEYDTSASFPVSTLTQEEICEWLDTLSSMNGYAPCYGEGGNYPTPYHCPGYRLPTEAEWEYAARAGTEGAVYGALEEIAWCSEGDWGEYLPVASLQSNAFGVYDMVGNVSELAEWLGPYPDEPVVNPIYPKSFPNARERLLVARGGTYLFTHSENACRAANRAAASTYNEILSTTLTGFRPVRTLPESDLPSPSSTQTASCAVAADDTCPSWISDPGALVLTSESFGEEVRFNAVVFGEVTAAIGTRKKNSGSEVFMAVLNVRQNVFASRALIDSGDTSPVALFSAADDSVMSLLCGNDTCYLAQSTLSHEVLGDNENGFAEVEGSTFPASMTPSDAAMLSDGALVVGDGIQIFREGTWHEVIPEGSGPAFNSVDVSAARQVAVAVGNEGRVAVINGDEWQELDSGVSENLLSVAVTGELATTIRLSAVGEAGVMVTGWHDALFSCKVGTTDLWLIRDEEGRAARHPDEIGYRIVDTSNTILYLDAHLSGRPPCITQIPISEKSLVDVSVNVCGWSVNPAYLFEDTLYGRYGCEIL